MKKFAQINFALRDALTDNEITQWKDVLMDGILDGSFIDEELIRVLYSAETNVFSVNIPLETEPMCIIHIGALLGYVSAEVTHSSKNFTKQWMSFNDEHGNEIESILD